ncbi:uncharacterized protein H6S33_002835 [Morchella sextelata]|uniref:uncharacterized protein n=1 Tax=Morchella sextelata TaxID=1174677 RepID=UPI001D04915E|nr:uncharacterized protein H6S33_002835 [Morchella sextelata]KAH0607801.1 hypothetical protein H6S33_002835 [Morchella sextelata]
MLRELPYISLDISSDLSLSRVSEASNGWINHYASILNIQKDPNDVFDVMAVRHQLHPLRWCVSIDKSDAHMLATPYMPIEHSVLGHDFTPETDPRVNSDPHSNMIDPSKDIGGARCDMFIPASTKTCDAAPQNRQPIVELFETKGKGVGVRSLQRIEGGMILAEYAGYITKEIVFHHPYVLHGPHAIDTVNCKIKS